MYSQFMMHVQKNTNRYRVLPVGKVRRGCDAGPSPPSSAVVKNRGELYLYSP